MISPPIFKPLKIKKVDTNIKLPKAFPGDRVYAHNYKVKKKNPNGGGMVDANKWEWGTVSSTNSGWQKDKETGGISVRHSYDVVLDRKVVNSRGVETSSLRIYLSEEQIQTETGI